MKPRTLRVSAAAEALGVGKTKFYQLLNQGVIRSFLIGRSRLVLAEDIDKLVQRGLNQEGK